MITSIIQALFLIKVQPNMSEQEKKWQRIYDLLNSKNQAWVSLSTIYKAKKKSLQKKIFLRKSGSGGLNKNKKVFLIALAIAIKDPTTSIRKYANELIVHKKTVMTAIKQD